MIKQKLNTVIKPKTGQLFSKFLEMNHVHRELINFESGVCLKYLEQEIVKQDNLIEAFNTSFETNKRFIYKLNKEMPWVLHIYKDALIDIIQPPNYHLLSLLFMLIKFCDLSKSRIDECINWVTVINNLNLTNMLKSIHVSKKLYNDVIESVVKLSEINGLIMLHSNFDFRCIIMFVTISDMILDNR